MKMQMRRLQRGAEQDSPAVARPSSFPKLELFTDFDVSTTCTAASIGKYAVDGCCEFMPAGEGTTVALRSFGIDGG
ncbi:hypothetical protein SASPL_134143 [Salvia splendens]|uniref:ZF-HD dimerization-type domain-containing protein n=1 Tax=Salvia splendens TaxID=180675 RepID=A0A8X8X5K0_SALSN|nr:hypothetical protein SASPL_134143 [Salvia splendens]